MSDFTSSFWHWYILIAVVVSILACGVFLLSQTKANTLKPGEQADLHGHVWDDDLQEYNNPLPRWWKWLFHITIVFGFVYLWIYPGLGTFAGSSGWSSTGQYDIEMKKADADYGPIFAKYASVDVPTLAKDPQAKAIGQRLFLNSCAPCHGSDAGGGKGFPNLSDKDWLYGGDPDAIKASILDGRNGIMPPLGDAIGGPAGVKEMANYVRSLSGLPHDAASVEAAKPKFAVCAACHGPDGKGNQQVGAPNLTDNIWLYGSSVETISDTIVKGRGANQLVAGQSAMPAHRASLGDAKAHLLAAYVYGLGGGMPAVTLSATPTPETAAAAPAATADSGAAAATAKK